MMTRSLPIALVATLLLAACGQEQKSADSVRPVLTVTVAPGAAATRDVYAGEVRARVETDLAFRIGGKIATRLVDAGVRVSRGQPLARLDPQDVKLAAEAARAQLASAESELALARAELERAADLLAKKFISQSAYDTRQASFTAAKARVQQALAQAAITANQESYATLAADADGVIVSVSAESGQVVAAGQPVMRLARNGEMEIVINVPEGQVARFRPGQDVAIALWADSATPFAGRVREIAGGADAVTRTFTVRVSVPQAPANARVGMSANIALQQTLRSRTRDPAPDGPRAPGRHGLGLGGRPEVLASQSASRETRPVPRGRRDDPLGRCRRGCRGRRRRAQAARRPGGADHGRARASDVARPRGALSSGRHGPPLQPLRMGARAPVAGALPDDRARGDRHRLLRAPRPVGGPAIHLQGHGDPHDLARARPPTRWSARSPNASRTSCRRRRSCDYIRSYSRPGESVVCSSSVKDSSQRRRDPRLWYQVRKKVGDIRHTLPPGIQRPVLQRRVRRHLRQHLRPHRRRLRLRAAQGLRRARAADLLRVPDVAKVDLIGVQDEKILIELSNTQDRHPRRAFRCSRVAALDAAERGGAGRQLRNRQRPHLRARHRRIRFGGVDPRHGDSRGRTTVPPGRRRRGAARLRRPAAAEDALHGGREAIGHRQCRWCRGGDILRLGDALERATTALQAGLPVGLTLEQVADQPRRCSDSVAEFLRVAGGSGGDRAGGQLRVASGFAPASSSRCRSRWCWR